MNENKVSIIVPVYNISEYIEECIMSICSQSYTSLEIIIVDDGSTDESGDICERLSMQDDRIRVIHKKNGGIVSARKAGLEVSSGKYVLNVDGDDWIDKDMVKTLFEYIDGSDYDYVESGFYYEDSVRREVVFDKGEYTICESDRDDIVGSFLKGNSGFREVIWTKLFAADYFKSIYMNIPDIMSNGEDVVFYVLSLGVSGQHFVIDRPLYHYRVRKESESHGTSIKVISTRQMSDAYVASIIGERYNVSHGLVIEWLMRRPFSMFREKCKESGIFIPKYMLSIRDKIHDCDVVIYGAGAVGQDYVYQLDHLEDIRITAWIDQDPTKHNDLFRKVEGKSRLVNLEYDYVIVAISDEIIASQIMEELKRDYYIDASKLIWEKPRKIELFG